jgi:hypothetical protein
MTETFNVGDKVVFEDAYTDETRYGVITQMSGGDAVIRAILKEEASGLFSLRANQARPQPCGLAIETDHRRCKRVAQGSPPRTR